MVLHRHQARARIGRIGSTNEASDKWSFATFATAGFFFAVEDTDVVLLLQLVSRERGVIAASSFVAMALM